MKLGRSLPELPLETLDVETAVQIGEQTGEVDPPVEPLLQPTQG